MEEPWDCCEFSLLAACAKHRNLEGDMSMKRFSHYRHRQNAENRARRLSFVLAFFEFVFLAT
jgi:hypothetical protein